MRWSALSYYQKWAAFVALGVLFQILILLGGGPALTVVISVLVLFIGCGFGIVFLISATASVDASVRASLFRRGKAFIASGVGLFISGTLVLVSGTLVYGLSPQGKEEQAAYERQKAAQISQVSSHVSQTSANAPATTVDSDAAAAHEKRSGELAYWNTIAVKYADAEVEASAAGEAGGNGDLVTASGDLKQAEDMAGEADYVTADGVPDGWDDVQGDAGLAAHYLVQSCREARKGLDEDTNANMSDAQSDLSAANDSMGQAYEEARTHFVTDGGDQADIQSPEDIIASVKKAISGN
jgi:hypothetical protein